MAYEVLARKWRPHNFQDMVGQTPILRMLENALEQQRLHHAYLLTGTRGVGKTTIARIFAKCLNCESGITAKPCDACDTCKAIDQGKFLDLYEIDAASRTKVEDTRELLDNVPYPPTQGRYKVYLIDEVHMLSNHSFNALLKTLEEPPAHVKFLLATTDPQKLPITILSRCLQFHLKRITVEQISQHLEHICKSESIEFESEALTRIAHAADGSMRDALSLLDQATAYGQGKVETQSVIDMLGSTSQDDVLPLMEALAEQNHTNMFTISKQLAERAPDYQQILEEVINILHEVAMHQLLQQSSNERIQALSQKINAEEVQLYYQIALLGRRDLALSPSPQQGFEMSLLRLAAFQPGESSIKTRAQPIQKPAAATAPNKANSNAPASPGQAAEWTEIIKALDLSGMAQAFVSNCQLNKIEGNRIELTAAKSHQAMLSDNLKQRLTQRISEHFNKPMQLDIKITDKNIETPASMQQQANNTKLATSKKNILSDPNVKQLIETYDASVDVSLLN